MYHLKGYRSFLALIKRENSRLDVFVEERGVVKSIALEDFDDDKFKYSIYRLIPANFIQDGEPELMVVADFGLHARIVFKNTTLELVEKGIKARKASYEYFISKSKVNNEIILDFGLGGLGSFADVLHRVYKVQCGVQEIALAIDREIVSSNLDYVELTDFIVECQELIKWVARKGD
jgi:hypothetical protein